MFFFSRTFARRGALCSTALGPCCKYQGGDPGAPSSTGGALKENSPFLYPHSEWGPQRLEVSHVHKVECVVPWLNDALVFFTVSLQLCQQLKDKVGSACWQGQVLPLPITPPKCTPHHLGGPLSPSTVIWAPLPGRGSRGQACSPMTYPCPPNLQISVFSSYWSYRPF